jgi:hypothetical protein
LQDATNYGQKCTLFLEDVKNGKGKSSVASALKTVRLNSSNMNTKIKYLVIVLAGLAGVHQAAAQGTAFSYQGQLQSDGSPANGLYDFQFALSNAPSGGSQVGSTATNLAVGVTNGVFTTTLDFGAVFTGNPTWLAISVRSNGLDNYVGLAPLQQLTPVPYAIFANSASNLSGTIPATQLSGALGNSQLANNSITVIAGTGLAGGGAVDLGGATTLSNAGVLSVTGNADITVSTVGGAVTLGDTATSSNTASTIVARDASGNFSAGIITANLAGNATTATTATNLTGNVSDAQLSDNVPLLNGTNAFTGTNTFAGVVMATNVSNVIVGAVSGNAFGLTNLNASQLTSGTVPLAQLPAAVLTNDQSDVSLDGLTTLSILSVTATNFANYLVVSNAPALDGSAITNLDASQLTSGTVPVAQLPIATTSALGVVQPDGSTITISNGVITATGGGGGAVVTTYITNAMINSIGLSNAFPHNLGTFPGFIHPILLCTANDAESGMVAGQMTEFTSVVSREAEFGVFASVSYDTTNVYIQTTPFPAEYYLIFPSEDTRPGSWDNFAIVVGYHQ